MVPKPCSVDTQNSSLASMLQTDSEAAVMVRHTEMALPSYCVCKTPCEVTTQKIIQSIIIHMQLDRKSQFSVGIITALSSVSVTKRPFALFSKRRNVRRWIALRSFISSLIALFFISVNEITWKPEVRIPVGVRDFYLLQNFQIDSGGHPASY